MQIDKEVILNNKSIWAGIFGPSTKKSLTDLLSDYYFQEEFNKLNLEGKYISELKKSSTI
jgi:hypothetical protein